MNYLRYSSDEMFSSTELIRKSKNIFDKLNKKQIEKAIILRDGKPGFMLLDFATYEKIMREFEKLNAKASKKTDDSYLSLDDIEIEINDVPVEEVQKTEIKNTPSVEEELVDTSIEEPTALEISDEEIDTSSITETAALEITQEEEKQLSEITQIDEMSSDEINDEELLQALAEIEKINIPNSDVSTGQTEVSTENLEMDLDDLESVDEIEEKKPSQPLKEFWDK